MSTPVNATDTPALRVSLRRALRIPVRRPSHNPLVNDGGNASTCRLTLVPGEHATASDEAADAIEARIEAAVERAVLRALAPHLRKLTSAEPATYTVGQAAAVLQISTDTVARLVKRGVLPRVPHLDGKLLIPRRAVDELVEGSPGPA